MRSDRLPELPRSLVIALLVAFPVLSWAARATAGPLEARRLYDAAKAKRNAPWPEAVRAYRAALAAAGRADSIRPRALKAIASIFQKAGFPHGAQAAFHSASRAGRRSDSLASLQLACARSLLAEGDLEAAEPLLGTVAALGAGRAPRETASALRLLSDLAFDRRDRRALRTLAHRMDEERLPHPLRIATYGRLGELQLQRAARLEAERTLARARRLFAESQDEADDAMARKAVKVWLDLPLRKALAR